MSVNARIKQRFDYLSNWIQNDIVLLQGELAVVDCGSQIRFKIGDGAKSFTQLPFTDQSQLSTKWLAAEAVSQGIHAASVPYGFAAGAYLCANASFSQALGYDAKALSSDTYSFTWSGDDTRAIGDYYTSHGKGSFSINPLSGLSGIFIGEQNLAEVLDENSGNTITIDDQISGICKETDLSIVKISAEDYANLVAGDALLSDVLYVVEGSYEDVYGQQVKNMAPGTDLSDAVNLEQLTEVSSRAYDTYTQTEIDQKIASAQYFKKYVVQTLPLLTEADERGIYLVPSSDPEAQNTHDEYVVVGEGSSREWEKIGSKSIDLSGYKTKQTAKTSPTASGTATAFIDTISQDENGVITATKKNIQAASTSLAGIVQLNNTLTSTSTTQAATANAVRALNNAKVENTVKVAGQALTANVTAATISSAIELSDYSLTSHTHSQYLTAVPSDYKTYNETKQSLSGDGYATQEQLDEKSAVSVDNVKTDVNMVHISLDDYNEKLVGGEILSNELYVISADYVETYGQQIKNVAPGTDLSDAVNYSQLLSGLGTKQPAGNYLTAVPSTYKTYAATLSSLSSDYSLTSHTHSGYVPTSRTVAGMQLTDNVSLKNLSFGSKNYNGSTALTVTAGDLGALTTHQPVSAVYANQHIRLSANNALVGNIDCSDFVKDGMLETVELCSDQLIFKFNVQSGKSDISVALSNFIDETNYYTKADLTGTNGILKGYVPTSRKVNNKQLTADVTLNASDVNALALSGGTVNGNISVNTIIVDRLETTKNAIGTVVSQIYSFDPGLSKYIYELDGEITLFTLSKIIRVPLNRGSLVDSFALESDLSNYSLSSHAHGSITNAGTISAAGVAVANGDSLVVVDSDQSSKIAKTAITFDGSTTSQFLSKKGTWETALTAVPNTYKTYASTKSSLSSEGYATSADTQLTKPWVITYSPDWSFGDSSVDFGDAGGMLDPAQWYFATEGGPWGTGNTNPDATELIIDGQISAVRGAYQLGKQSDKLLQPAGNYLTAVPDTYKTYAATLSSLSSTYSLTSHTHTGYVPTSRTVAGYQLTGNVTAANISSAIGLSCYLPLKGGTIANPTGYTDLWLSDGKTNGYAELGVEKGNHYIELFCTSADSYIDADNYTYRFPNKNGTLARQEDLNYALSTATGVLSSGSYVYDVADRTITTIGINQSTTPVIVRLPDAGNGARDFILRIEISSTAAPSFTFANTAGLTIESEDDDWAVMEPGLNIVSFTETKR